MHDVAVVQIADALRCTEQTSTSVSAHASGLRCKNKGIRDARNPQSRPVLGKHKDSRKGTSAISMATRARQMYWPAHRKRNRRGDITRQTHDHDEEGPGKRHTWTTSHVDEKQHAAQEAAGSTAKPFAEPGRGRGAQSKERTGGGARLARVGRLAQQLVQRLALCTRRRDGTR